MYRRRCKNCCIQSNYVPNDNDTISMNINMNLSDNDSCDCGFDYEDSIFPENPVLGQSYVPIQKMDKTFKPCVGLKMGTLFPELVSPYRPCQSMEEIAFIKAMNTIGKGCNKC